MSCYGGGSGVEPIFEENRRILLALLRNWLGWEKYQSIDCGGSSLEWEVLTVSTQPERGSRNQPFILGKRSPGKFKAGRREAG